MWCSISVYVADVVHFCVEINSEFGGADGSNFFAHYLLDWNPYYGSIYCLYLLGKIHKRTFMSHFFLDIITQNNFFVI